MMQQPIKKANLPENKVKTVLADHRISRAILNTLYRKGIDVILIPGCEMLPEPVCSHPDMLCHHLSGNKVVVYKHLPDYLKYRLTEAGFMVTEGSSELVGRYPYDCSYNAARVGTVLFCKLSILEPKIREYDLLNKTHIIPIHQGYAKCSICIVDEKSIITSDPGIAAAAKEQCMNVLQIRSGYVGISEYEYGFIGGACGKLSPNILSFTGKIENHPDYISIRRFLHNRGVIAESLSNDPLYDFGSLIPLAEEE